MTFGNSEMEQPLDKPRRLSELAVNLGVYLLDWVAPTNIERGAIAVPDSIRERAKRRGMGRRPSYDPLRSPPPEYAEEEFAESSTRRTRSLAVEELKEGTMVESEEVER